MNQKPAEKVKTFSKIVAVFILTLLFTLTFNPNANAQSEGEQLFTVCAACHTIGGGDLIGPDLKGVTERLDEEWLIKFIQNSTEVIQSGDEYAVKIFEKYNKIPMPPNNLTDDQVRTLLAYIDSKSGGAEEAATEPAAEEVKEEEHHAEIEVVSTDKPIYEAGGSRKHGTIFIISLIVFLFAIVDLAFTRIIKAKFVNIILIILGGIIMIEITVVEAIALGRQEYYQPDQPVWFSHKVHVDQNQIDCQYCHTGVMESKSAGIPSTNLCLNCHNVVKEGTITGKDEIAKIYASRDSGKPIPWVKVHNLPDHVFFSHAQHVNAGQLDCVECHGEVEKMHKIMQVEDLSMGWCINCHRETEVLYETNEFYKHYAEIHEKYKNGEIDKITAQTVGANDCAKCHY